MVRIGAGAGFAADRFEPAVDLAQRGELDFLVYEGLAERTLAHGHLARHNDPGAGYNKTLARRMRDALAACRAGGTTIVTNMGAANPLGAGREVAEVARSLDLGDTRVAVLSGDDVTSQIDDDTWLPEAGRTVGEIGLRVLGANAYLGAEGIVAALDLEPHVVVTGRVADPSLFVAPVAHRLGWSLTDWDLMGAGTLIGHLLECSSQITGGYFADPGRKDVPNVAYVGFPLAEVASAGDIVITKLDGTGGCVTELTVKEQLLYEVHDPAAYLTPDVVADFSGVSIAEQGRDRIAVAQARGRPRPDTLKVIVGFEGGFLAEGEISYAGPGAAARARLAADILCERMQSLHGCDLPIRIDLIGVASLHANAGLRSDPEAVRDVRLRAAMRTADRALADTLVAEVETLWVCGPAGGGGFRGRVDPTVITHAAYIPRDQVPTTVEVL